MSQGHKKKRPADAMTSDNHDNGAKKKRLKSLSHALSWALRHEAPNLGLTMTKDGYVSVQDVLHCPHDKFTNRQRQQQKESGKHVLIRVPKFTTEDIHEVVESNDKQRFKLEFRPSNVVGRTRGEPILCIRANQGHSIPGLDLSMTPISVDTLPMVVHGTNYEAFQHIQETKGLKRMTRQHIHFARGLPHDEEVISGMRKSCTVYLFVDREKCAKDSDRVTFYESDNGVILTEGLDHSGILPLEYISHVTDRHGKILLENRK